MAWLVIAPQIKTHYRRSDAQGGFYERLIIRIHKDKQSNTYSVTAYLGAGDNEGIPNAACFRNPLKIRALLLC